MKKQILVVGNKGLIGTSIQEHLELKFGRSNVEGIDLCKEFDLRERSSIQDFLKKKAGINYIVNASGLNDHVSKISDKKHKYQTDIDYIDDFLLLNVKAVCWLIEDAKEFLTNFRGIINFASLYGIKAPYHPIYETGKSLSYTLSKHALEGITRYYSTLYGPLDISVNSIRIGGIETSTQPGSFKEWFVSRTPKQRMASPNDLMGTIELLCNFENAYITGQTISIDGGLLAW
jgi:3-oxoacyl-[acyl-carrier protein] reductase